MLPHDASQLYDWTPSSRLSYGEFLRAKQVEGAIRYAIDNQNKSLIATNQQLSEHGIAVLSTSHDRDFTLLVEDIALAAEPATASPARVVGRLNWGFSDALVSHGQMNVPLAELVSLTKAASQVWACEQFEIARDEFRRQLYPEALQSATRAIEGQDGNPGIKTEFRCHFLVGLIRLGSYRNAAEEVLDPRLARESFLAAARCAQALYPADAGLALICAGRAALLEGAMDPAIEHTRKGLAWVPTHAAGTYQLGRALFLKGSLSEATDRLTDAILLDAEQALHACSDPDFVARIDFLNGVVSQAQERLQLRQRLLVERFRRAEKELREFSFEDLPAEALQLAGLAEIHKVRKAAEAESGTGTLFGYSGAVARLIDGFRLFPACFDEFKTKCIQRLQERISRPPRREDFSDEKMADLARQHPASSGAWLASGIVSGITLFVVHACQTAPPSYTGLLDATADLFTVPLLFGAGVALVIALLEQLYREYVRSKSLSALAAYDAAWYAHCNLKNLLENEIASIRSIDLPAACRPPPLATPGEVAAGSRRQG